MNTNPEAKVIVCYGDSNTWGAIPYSDNRLPSNIRWPGVLQNLLGNEYDVINEGLCGRTLVVEDPEKPHRTGITHLTSIVKTNNPIDLIIIMLGTNDMKTSYNLQAEDIGTHLEETINSILRRDEDEKIPKILIICPPAVVRPLHTEFDERMSKGIEISKELPNLYQQISNKYNCHYINAEELMNLTDTDGYHLDVEDHKNLAEVIRNKVKEIFK